MNNNKKNNSEKYIDEIISHIVNKKNTSELPHIPKKGVKDIYQNLYIESTKEKLIEIAKKSIQPSINDEEDLWFIIEMILIAILGGLTGLVFAVFASIIPIIIGAVLVALTSSGVFMIIDDSTSQELEVKEKEVLEKLEEVKQYLAKKYGFNYVS